MTDFTQARSCAHQYTSRWIMEDFHKALGTGVGAEKRQLQTAVRLFAAVALLSMVALANLREKNRLKPDTPAKFISTTDNQLLVMHHQRRRPLATVRGVYLAAIGGHLGRTSNSPSSWQILWLGRLSLRLLVEEVNIAAQLPDQ